MSEKPNLSGRPFTKGTSGNPGGRCSLEKAWDAATEGKKKKGEVAAEVLKMVLDRALEGPNGNAKGDADWRFAVQKTLDYTIGPPRQTIEITDDRVPVTDDLSPLTEEQLAALAVLDATNGSSDPTPTTH